MLGVNKHVYEFFIVQYIVRLVLAEKISPHAIVRSEFFVVQLLGILFV